MAMAKGRGMSRSDAEESLRQEIAGAIGMLLKMGWTREEIMAEAEDCVRESDENAGRI